MLIIRCPNIEVLFGRDAIVIMLFSLQSPDITGEARQRFWL